jgi:hypothetical protein
MTEIFDPRIGDDPLAFVKFAFPWGKKGTPLEHHPGPRSWQIEELTAIKDHILHNKRRAAQKLPYEIYRSATASGRGPGKSALVSWLTLWFLSTRLGGTCIVTANTEAQLKSRTWAELGKWHTLLINSHWFEKSALHLRPSPWFESAMKTELKIDTGYYYAHAQLWSEENPDAFAGVHNHYGLLVIFDEASGIPAPIWKVTDGFFTDPTLHRYYFAFSNPRRGSGEFFECFHKHRDYWRRRNLDSRTVEGTDHKVLQDIVDKYGEDSDEARVEVKGQFPRQGDRQFMNREDVLSAVARNTDIDHHAALIMGVDIARFGTDSTVIRWRQGRNGKVLPPVKLKGRDNMEVANTISHLINTHQPDAVCIDAGNGTGVIDRLREMGHRVYEIWFGAKADDAEWANKRTELWARMREWLKGGMIDNDQELLDDMTAPEYKFQGNSDKIMLESKEDLRKKGFSSPDNADALACTFFVKVARRDSGSLHRGDRGKKRVAKDVDYNIFGG